MARPPRIPVWLPWDHEVIYFVTMCVADRQPVLADERSSAAIKESFGALQRWKVIAGVIMPDHLHVFLCPLDRDESLSTASAFFKRTVRKRLGFPDWRWQEGCFDRLLRSDESVHEKWLYVRENPVRAGLVSDPEDWPYWLGDLDGR